MKTRIYLFGLVVVIALGAVSCQAKQSAYQRVYQKERVKKPTYGVEELLDNTEDADDTRTTRKAVKETTKETTKTDETDEADE